MWQFILWRFRYHRHPPIAPLGSALQEPGPGPPDGAPIAKTLYYKWTVETLNRVVDAELEALPADLRARFVHISRLLEEFGLERVREPHVKHLRGPLWEMRLKGQDGIARAIYVTASGSRVVVVRAFVKKTQQTPRREIELAMQRVKEIQP